MGDSEDRWARSLAHDHSTRVTLGLRRGSPSMSTLEVLDGTGPGLGDASRLVSTVAELLIRPADSPLSTTLTATLAQVCTQADAFSTACGLAPGDHLVSWLPLDDHVGLGFSLLALLSGLSLTLGTPDEFQARPAAWMERVSLDRAAATVAPGEAYRLAAGALAHASSLDLTCLRAAVVTQPVTAATTRAFCRQATRWGFRPSALLPVLTRPEVPIAVTMPAVGAGARFDRAGPTGVSPGVAPIGAWTEPRALLGRPIGGVEVRLIDPTTGVVALGRHQGELQLRGPSVAVTMPTRPAGRVAPGWHTTGQLGHRVRGELVLDATMPAL